MPPRGDWMIEQNDADALVDGVIESVDHDGLIPGLDDQAPDPPVDGSTDRAGQVLRRRPFLRIGLGEPKGSLYLRKLDPQELLERGAVGVRRPGKN